MRAVAISARVALVVTTCVSMAWADAPKKSGAGRTASSPKPAPPKKPSPAKYAQAVKTWHTPAKDKKAPRDARDRPLLVLTALNTGEHLELTAATDEGTFHARDLDRAAHLLRESSSAQEHPVEPRLLDLLYRIQRKFDAQEIRVVSGFRPGRAALFKGPVRATGSNHSCGRATDIVVPGARDEDVAKFARELGFVGVGLYPNSGFVHVDVRGRSYFWVDRSGPGSRNRERGVLGDLAKKSDTRALSRGERPLAPFSIGGAIESFLEGAGEPVEAAEEDDDV